MTKKQTKQPSMNEQIRAAAGRNQTTVVARETNAEYKQAGDWIRQHAKRNTFESSPDELFTQEQEQQQ